MQITEHVMPQFKPVGKVFLDAEMHEETKKETKEDLVKEVLTKVQKFIEYYTLKISTVIVKICKKKELKYDVAIKDASLVPKVFQRSIGVKQAHENGEESYRNVVKFTVDCRKTKIDIKIDVDPCCPKAFKTRVKAQIKNLSRR